jgi:hypothetical protein
MSSSDRSDGGDSGREAPGAAPSEPNEPEPERSPRGRILIRSSSHPPGSERSSDAREVSGARALPASGRAPASGADPNQSDRDDARSKKTTPAERPRSRRKLQSARHSFDAGSASTPEGTAVPKDAVRGGLAGDSGRAARVRRAAITLVIAVLFGAVVWAAFRR